MLYPSFHPFPPSLPPSLSPSLPPHNRSLHPAPPLALPAPLPILSLGPSVLPSIYPRPRLSSSPTRPPPPSQPSLPPRLRLGAAGPFRDPAPGRVPRLAPAVGARRAPGAHRDGGGGRPGPRRAGQHRGWPGGGVRRTAARGGGGADAGGGGSRARVRLVCARAPPPPSEARWGRGAFADWLFAEMILF